MRVPPEFFRKCLVIAGFSACAASHWAHAARAPGTARQMSAEALAPALTIAPAPARLSHGRFKDFPVYAPIGQPSSFALLLSGDDGWTMNAELMAHQLVRQGAMVTGIDLAKFKANLRADPDQCVSPDGDLENLSHFVQAYYHLPSYLAPMLVGSAAGATFAYAVLAQAPRNTFAAAVTLSFCPTTNLNKPLCRGSGLQYRENARGRGVTLLPAKMLGNPWVALQGTSDLICPAAEAADFISQVQGAALVTLPNMSLDRVLTSQDTPPFAAAYARLASQPTTRIAPPPASLSDLPIIEVPAAPRIDGARSDMFAIFMSGDGGWAGLDQDVAAALIANGIPVVGLDSLRYFWTARSADSLAADIDRMIRYYLAHFGKSKALLIGYSQGADVLPFAVNRLPDATRAHVALTTVMGMSEHALFEFHLSSWVSDSRAGPATLPEINRLSGTPLLCIYGEEDRESLCPRLDAKKFHIVKFKGGHHFDGDYAALAREIIAAAGR